MPRDPPCFVGCERFNAESESRACCCLFQSDFVLSLSLSHSGVRVVLGASEQHENRFLFSSP